MSSRSLAMRLGMAVVLAAPIAAAPLPAPSAESAGSSGASSDAVELVASIPEMAAAISLAFDEDVMFVSTATGIWSYDIADPSAPSLLGSVPHYIWENEDMDFDAERDLLFVSRDPRGFTGVVAPAQARPFGAVEIYDVSNPSVMVPVSTFTVPAGHTSSCVSAGEGRCDFLWTGGPYGNESFGPYGRPIYSTDIRDPRNPVTCPEPINTGLYDGETGYAHDVQVDDQGVAWVSSEGGVHGWWTFGEHLDPTTGETATATPCEPIPYAGGGSPQDATPSRFMHNSLRPSHVAIPGDEDSRGMILLATEEQTSIACATSGRFATYDLRSSTDGAGFTDPADFRLDVLDTWTPEDAEGATGCASAHYFTDRGDGLLAYSFYGQGVRFLDASDPTDIRQVAWYRPDDANAFSSYWRQIGDEWFVFVADFTRGVDILRFTPSHGGGSPASLPTVEAPPLSGGSTTPLVMDRGFGYLCPLPLKA